ncbi:hypothetical protein AWC14_14220 [Mycobacterium kyorinense]|uniref:Uncharacterized protein n=1 Tax=Mycobacterium kyorinense TaxID=487514 RepID=A0A1X1XGS4_9MYCO|nr:hypothetical protein AWC14_14220 [Mycobacterium kyorinense]
MRFGQPMQPGPIPNMLTRLFGKFRERLIRPNEHYLAQQASLRSWRFWSRRFELVSDTLLPSLTATVTISRSKAPGK